MKINQLIEALKKEKALIYTGAGVSTNSGISDFRSTNGFYQKYHEDDLAVESFFRDPDKFYVAFQEKFSAVFKAKPNQTHTILADLENQYIGGIITQNVDQLHQDAGSKKVIEFHGNIFFFDLIHIIDANKGLFRIIQEDVHIDHIRKHDQIEYRLGKYIYKPKVVLYGEGVYDWSESVRLSKLYNVHIIMGTSFLVTPFNMLSYENQNPNLKVFVINNEPIRYDHHNHAEVIQIIGDTSEILRIIQKELTPQ